MTPVEIYAELAVATALVLAPGWLVARTLGVRSFSASIGWSLTKWQPFCDSPPSVAAG